MFITFEGLDFSGKSTQVNMLATRLKQEGRRVLVLREPGGTKIGEHIRSILLDKKNTGLTEAGELFLFSASRAQLVHDIIRPALLEKTTVICDRYADSTTAYQGYGRGIPLEVIGAVNRYATGGLSPDLTFVIDVPLDELDRRMRASGSMQDRMESNGRPFYERVRNGFLTIALQETRVRVLDGALSVDALHDRIWKELAGR
jgi:dTMP kinase